LDFAIVGKDSDNVDDSEPAEVVVDEVVVEAAEEEPVAEEEPEEEAAAEEEEAEEEEEEEEEEDLVDPQDTLKDKCTNKPECMALKEKLDECNARVESRSRTTETCVEELIDFMHCVDHCVSKTLFSKLK
jgi:ubiquinol-cytochrome c reductase subunit 6